MNRLQTIIRNLGPSPISVATAAALYTPGPLLQLRPEPTGVRGER